MRDLGSFKISTRVGLKEASQKLHEMSNRFGFDAIDSARLSTIFTELLSPEILTGQIDMQVRVRLGHQGNTNGIFLTVQSPVDLDKKQWASQFMDPVDGETSPRQFHGFRAFPDIDYYPSQIDIQMVQDLLSQPSREEMFNDLIRKNQELKDAQDKTEAASKQLQKQVTELDRAKRAMLNIMDDLDDAKKKTEEALNLVNSSINYATNIQSSILPSREMLASVFSDYFVLWEPRDRVGGDIYYCKTWGTGKFIALVDCTGHGVPGAFVTMIANGALDMAILETREGDSAALLQQTHKLLQKALGQQNDKGKSDDGLEIGLCYIHPQKPQMIYSGARFSIFIIENGEVNEIKGDKRYGLGYRATPPDVQFTNHEVLTRPNQTFYITTDGLIDQVGGPKRRGFSKKRFKRMILEMETVPMNQRSDFIKQRLKEYQGDESRRDDVSIIGFSLSPIG